MYPGTDNAKPHESRIHPKMDDANTRHSFSIENVCRGVFNTPLHGDENGTRGVAAFVIGDENDTCGVAYTRFVSLFHLCVMKNEYTHEHKI